MTKFSMLHSRRAFVHWYVGEGMEESELIEASNAIAQLQMDYREIGDNSGTTNHPENSNDQVTDPQAEACPCP